jgi:transcriptional regulator with PAS, ATPase and Fis domain
MQNTLILTGWGWKEYSVAAAAVLQALGGAADVRGVSRRRLPELLEELETRYKRIYIIGVSLAGDPGRLETALKALKKRGVRVSWVSAMPMDVAQYDVLSSLLEENVVEGELLDAVGKVFNVDVSRLKPYAVESKRPSGAVKAYHELIEASMYAYRNYQDEYAYAKVVDYLANGVSESAWAPDVRRLVDRYRRYRGRELIGKSSTMRRLQERINKVAGHPDARVLILGESGTGKETVALQIHSKSSRRHEPFYAFNCASVTPNLLESRFFGHEKGAFTGADRQQPGLFELANGGTLFLDEIGELPIEAQGTLLRVLEGGRFMRMGGREEIETDVRLVTATNRNLPAFVREGRFREDLYQRLNVIQLRIPSLREHKDDIRDIADGWWLQHNKRHLSEAQISALMKYEYPGNVRELLNLLERATVLDEMDFNALLDEHREMNAGLIGEAGEVSELFTDELEAAIRFHVRRVFDKYGQNLSRAAEALKVARNTVRKYL